MEATYMSVDRWIDKDICICIHIYTHNGILLSYKKEWNNAVCSDMGGPRGYF